MESWRGQSGIGLIIFHVPRKGPWICAPGTKSPHSIICVCPTLTILQLLSGRMFAGVSIFHQIHCLQVLQLGLINGPSDHSGHCFNFLRQIILCSSDITFDPAGTGGMGVTHLCRDWSQVYTYVTENQKGPMWAEKETT